MNFKSENKNFDHVDYGTLDAAKNAFIKASQKTLNFASKFGFVGDEHLGASANIFNLSLKPFIEQGLDTVSITLLPEGLGTADDARPEDLSSSELEEFWFNIGIKSIAVMTNDASTAGMQTVLIGMYLPSAQPEKVFTKEFMKGFLGGYVEGCRQVECVYISGETPQLKNKIHEDKLDIAGALFGLVPPGIQPINSGNLKANDYIVLVESSGPHENGFTTFRALSSKLKDGYRTKTSDGVEFWRAINKGSKLYTPLIQNILREGIFLTNAENITGHGWQKIMRSSGLFSYQIENYPKVLPVFEMVKEALDMSYQQLFSVFNCGSGLALFVRTKEDAESIVKVANKQNLKAVIAGQVVNSNGNFREVIIKDKNIRLGGEEFNLSK